MAKARHTYALRLAVEGGNRVKADLVSVGESGERSMRKIDRASDRAWRGLRSAALEPYDQNRKLSNHLALKTAKGQEQQWTKRRSAGSDFHPLTEPKPAAVTVRSSRGESNRERQERQWLERGWRLHPPISLGGRLVPRLDRTDTGSRALPTAGSRSRMFANRLPTGKLDRIREQESLWNIQ